jgi:hypothetical protein
VCQVISATPANVESDELVFEWERTARRVVLSFAGIADGRYTYLSVQKIASFRSLALDTSLRDAHSGKV